MAAEGGLQKMQKFDISCEEEEQEIRLVAGETNIKVKQFAAKHRLDARATAKLENGRDSVAEKVMKTSMGHMNNPLAYISNTVRRNGMAQRDDRADLGRRRSTNMEGG